eukprot:scaffold342805_cov102-Attheya_sp.AAC.1
MDRRHAIYCNSETLMCHDSQNDKVSVTVWWGGVWCGVVETAFDEQTNVEKGVGKKNGRPVCRERFTMDYMRCVGV